LAKADIFDTMHQKIFLWCIYPFWCIAQSLGALAVSLVHLLLSAQIEAMILVQLQLADFIHNL